MHVDQSGEKEDRQECLSHCRLAAATNIDRYKQMCYIRAPQCTIARVPVTT
jgi:hypothetical protein